MPTQPGAAGGRRPIAVVYADMVGCQPAHRPDDAGTLLAAAHFAEWSYQSGDRNTVADCSNRRPPLIVFDSIDGAVRSP
jgi:hypothetical protein